MTESNGRPDGSPDLAPASSYEVPVVTAALSRRALRERLEASSVPIVAESRRERRERELAEAAAAASVASERPSAVAEPIAVEAAVAASASASAPALAAERSPAPSRRARRDIQGLEHLLLAPVDTSATRRLRGTEVTVTDTAKVDTTDVEVVTAEPLVATVVQPEPQVATDLKPAAAAVAPAVVAPAPAVEPTDLPTVATSAAAIATEAQAAVPDGPAAPETAASTMTFSHADDTTSPARVSAPRGARSSISADSGVPRARVVPRLRRTGGSNRPGSKKRAIASSVVMVATAGLVATLALPAYAYSLPDSAANPNLSASSELGIQSLTVQGVNAQSSTRDDYSTTGNVAAMDSTTGTTVSPTVQALAAELMADVASGKLVGSVPDHIVEIRNLANGIAVPGCGVDYRVLQTIKVAVDNFDKVGVSDINRACTGQIEGAGTASSHYKDGGGHAVDFYILNGHGLTGADSDSLKLIRILDPLVPKGSGLGQSECRAAISVTNFAPFPDTCTHMHVDFGAAQGVSLKS